MTFKQYKERYSKLTKANDKVLVFGFNEQTAIDFIKVEAFEITVEKDFLHTFGGKPEWTKNFVFLIGELCGAKCKMLKSDKISKHSFVSSYEARRLNPSGDNVSDEGTYEFDAEIRVDSEYWKERADNVSNDPEKAAKYKYKTEAQKMYAISQLSILGRSKADTGAEKRAIIKLLKFPKPEYPLLGTHVFCLRCVPDMENIDVRTKFLNSGSPAESIFSSPRIEQKTENKIKPESGDIAVTESEISLEAKREDIKDTQRALYKLSGIVLESRKDIEELLIYMNGYDEMDRASKIDTLYGWISRVEKTPVLSSEKEKGEFLVGWGK